MLDEIGHSEQRNVEPEAQCRPAWRRAGRTSYSTDFKLYTNSILRSMPRIGRMTTTGNTMVSTNASTKLVR